MSPSALASFRAITLAIFPWLAVAGVHTYRVAVVNADGSIDLDPPPASTVLPKLPRVGQWTLGGAEIKPVVGSEVLILFRDNDTSRPAIVAFVPLAGTSGKPDKITLNTGADKPIAIGADSGSINLGGAGATALAKANAVSNNLSGLKNAFQSALASAVPGDGGVALVTAALTALAAWPASMATIKVEGK